MSADYIRCNYIDSNDHQCGIWFRSPDGSREDSPEPRMCPLHSGIISPRNATIVPEIKNDYLNLVNEERAYARSLVKDKMDHQAIDQHIAQLEGEIEKLKAKAAASRAVKSEIIQDLNEEERRELRKIKISKEPKARTNGSSAQSEPKDPQQAALEKVMRTLKAQRESMGKPISDEAALKLAKNMLGL